MRSESIKNFSPSSQIAAFSLLIYNVWCRRGLKTRAVMVKSIAFLFASRILSAASPVILREVVNYIRYNNADKIAIMVILLGIYCIVRFSSRAFDELRDFIFAPVVQREIRETATALIRKYHDLEASFHIDRQTGSATRLIDRGLRAIENLLGFGMIGVMPVVLDIVLAVVVMYKISNLPVVVVFLCIVGMYFIFTVVSSRGKLELRRELNAVDGLASSIALEALFNIEVIKYFNTQEFEVSRYDFERRRYEQLARRSQAQISFTGIGQSAIMALGMFAVMVILIAPMKGNKINIGDIVLVNAYIIQLYQPLTALGAAYRGVVQSLVDYEEVVSFLAIQGGRRGGARRKIMKNPIGEIEFKNVFFEFESGCPVLKDISFCVPAGKSVAIVGATGGGKSTIVRLLTKVFDPDCGKITIGGEDISGIDSEDLRDIISIVPQEIYLFNQTIYFNISYGASDVSEADVVEAAREACLHDFISGLPDGYSTIIGERGVKLSGGERQRIAIARAILKRAPILILDEPTSALDMKTEREVHDKIFSMPERTTIIIAHRLSSVVGVDNVLVVDRGEIVERGTHVELLDRGGMYALMWGLGG